MKTKLLLSALLSFSFYLLSSQVPQGFNYQAIARDVSGNPIINATLSIRLSILSDSNGYYPGPGGTYIWEEEQTNVKTNAFGLFNVIFGATPALKTAGTAGSFAVIDWSQSPLFIGTKIYYQSTWKTMGAAKLWSVPYSLVAGELGGTVDKIKVKGTETQPDSALFEVRNLDGQIVFAVYNEGVRVYVDDGAKGNTKGGFAIGSFGTDKAPSKSLLIVNPDSIRAYIDTTNSAKGVTKGGFAIGGFGEAKGKPQDFLRVTRDSTRVYVYDDAAKGNTKGGFAIGGFDNAKGLTQSLMTVSKDSIRIYIDDNAGKGNTKGGFAIGGFDNAKGGNTNFLNVATDPTGKINPSQNRVLWYPLDEKNAFLVGKVLILNKDSVGVNSVTLGYESMAKGAQSQAFGYMSKARGAYSTAIGYQAVAHKASSFALGETAKAMALNSYSFGRNTEANGQYSFAFGESVKAGTATNSNSYAFGRKSEATGKSSYAIGDSVIAQNSFSYAFGKKSQAKANSSYAMGDSAITLGTYTYAFGKKAVATGTSSYALGNEAKAQVNDSYAIGSGASVTGPGGFALGSMGRDTLGALTGVNTLASGNYSFSLGLGSISTSMGAFALGASDTASGEFSYAIGYGSKVTGKRSFAIGDRAIAAGDYSLSIGYPMVSNTSTHTYRKTENSAPYSIAIGGGALASYPLTIAIGTLATSSGGRSIAIGFGSPGNTLMSSKYTISSGMSSIAIGNMVTATKTGAIGIGTLLNATAQSSISIGYDNYTLGSADSSLNIGTNVESRGKASVAIGANVAAYSYHSTVLGRYNNTGGNTTSWVAEDPLFVVGNGTSSARSNALTLLKNGNLGILTSAPTHTLDVRGQVRIVSGGSYDVWIQGGAAYSMGDARNLALLGFNDALVLNWQSEYVNGTEVHGHFNIWGNEGPAASSANPALTIRKNVTGNAAASIINLNNTNTADGLYIQAGQTTWTTGGAKFVKFLRNDGTEIGSIKQNASSTIQYYTPSDLRLKENIVSTNFGLSDLMKIQIKDFNFIDDINKTRITGFIAQDLFNVFPDAVSKPSNVGEYWQVDYGRITPLLVKAIQDQQRQIEELKEKNKEIDILRAELEQIKAMLLKGGVK